MRQRLTVHLQKAIGWAWLVVGMAFLGNTSTLTAQTAAETESSLQLRGALSVTSNGFSFIPSFSLGKPATILSLNVNNGKRLSFEPEFRYSLAGKPWSFIFIWRYKLLRREHFQLTLGAHLPAISFRTVSVVRNDVRQDVLLALPFFPTLEVAPNFTIANQVSAGLFYLYGRHVDENKEHHAQLLSMRLNFTKIPLGPHMYARFMPQVFYLKTDAPDGWYTAANLVLAHTNLPFTLGSMCTKALRSNIVTKDFQWNVSVGYQFAKKWGKK